MKIKIIYSAIFLPLIIAFLLLVIICFPVIRIYVHDLMHAWEFREPTTKQMRKYYQKLPEPILTARQVVEQMREQKGLQTINGNSELIKMAKWYVYHGDKKVIKQLIANLTSEVELDIVDGENNEVLCIRKILGQSYFILENKHNLLTHIDPILHEELHRYATDPATNPYLIYLIIRFIRDRFEINNFCDYISRNIDWYTTEMQNQDVLAFLRIYVNYADWPGIRAEAMFSLSNFPTVDTFDNVYMGKILRLADEKGAEAAYELFLKQSKIVPIEEESCDFPRAVDCTIHKPIYRSDVKYIEKKRLPSYKMTIIKNHDLPFPESLDINDSKINELVFLTRALRNKDSLDRHVNREKLARMIRHEYINLLYRIIEKGLSYSFVEENKESFVKLYLKPPLLFSDESSAKRILKGLNDWGKLDIHSKEEIANSIKFDYTEHIKNSFSKAVTPEFVEEQVDDFFILFRKIQTTGKVSLSCLYRKINP